MLSVANLNTWNDYFKQTAIKNCDVHIYGVNGALILDKSQIESFSLTMRNCYVCKEIPNDVCTIKINKWNELTENKKTYLSTKGNCVKVSYIVEGEETTNCKVLTIDKIKIDRTGTKATLNLVNPLEQLTEINKYIYAGGYFDEDYNVFPYGSNAVSGAYPLNSTTAECIQLYALDKSRTTAKGFRTYKVDKASNFRLDNYNPYDTNNFTDFDPTSLSCSLLTNNVLDYDYSVDEEGNDQIVVYGASKNAIEITEKKFPKNSPSYDWSFFLEDEVFVANVRAYTGYNNDQQGNFKDIWEFFAHLYCDKVRVTWQSDPEEELYDYLTLVLMYRKLELTNIESGVTNYIQSKAFLEDYVSAIQTSIRNYYSNKNMIDIKCRMNPIFEPLDIIQTKLDDRLINIALEEVTINFNGGFTGSIKGRIVWELTSLVAPTVQFNINEQNFVNGVNDSYNFVVTNSNPVAVDMVFANEDSEVITKVSIPANSTVTLYSTTDLNNDLDEYVRARNIELYGYFECEEIQSSSVLVLETRSIIPPTVTSSVYGNTFDITVKNDNLYEVYLNIDYSGGTLQEIIPPYSTRQFNQNDLPELIASAEAYDDSQLANAVSCYFEHSDVGVSDTTIIWEANGE